MQLITYRHLWGFDEPWESAFARARAEGFSGIESALPAPGEEARFRALLAAHGLAYIPQIFTSGADVDGHIRSFALQLGRAAAWAPPLVNVHGGSDAWDRTQARTFYAAALDLERAHGVAVAHETHRGRVFYNPWATRDLLGDFPALRLTCDYSHWVCVAERLLDGEWPILRLCAEHALHLHARVGYEEGPQVPDPRAPEYQAQVEAHERWWDLVWDSQSRRQLATTTLTPEFGPPGYLHTLPFSGRPVADLAEICAWQGRRQAGRFASGSWQGACERPPA
jgi:sugar phosphate isomerase/epimerase